MQSKRPLILIAALLASSGLTLSTWLKDRYSSPRVEVVRATPARAAETTKKDASVPALLTQRVSRTDGPANAFTPVSFLPPPPVTPPPIAAPAAPPVAPPFPYRYFGKMTDALGDEHVYLARNDQLFPVQVGQVLENEYRVEVLTADEIRIKYLPLDQPVTIRVASAAQ